MPTSSPKRSQQRTSKPQSLITVIMISSRIYALRIDSIWTGSGAEIKFLLAMGVLAVDRRFSAQCRCRCCWAWELGDFSADSAKTFHESKIQNVQGSNCCMVRVTVKPTNQRTFYGVYQIIIVRLPQARTWNKEETDVTSGSLDKKTCRLKVRG